MKAKRLQSILFYTSLVMMTFLFITARADHTTGIMANAPPAVQECYAKAQLYQQLIVTRQAGLTREEVAEYNAFTMRVVKYVTEKADEHFDETEEMGFVEKTAEVFAIPDEDLASDAYLNDWVGVKYTACIEAIPDEIIINDGDAQSIDRMLLPE